MSDYFLNKTISDLTAQNERLHGKIDALLNVIHLVYAEHAAEMFDSTRAIVKSVLEQNVVSTPESPVRGSNTNGNQGRPGEMPGTTICKHGVNTAISICPSCAVREYQLRS